MHRTGYASSSSAIPPSTSPALSQPCHQCIFCITFIIFNVQTGEFITVSPDIAASCTCPELLRACLIYVDDYGGNLLSDSSKAMLEPLRSFARGAGRDVCAAPSMDIWAAAVLTFELMRTPGGEEGKDGSVALFGSKMEVSSLSTTQRLHVSLCHRNFNSSHIIQHF